MCSFLSLYVKNVCLLCLQNKFLKTSFPFSNNNLMKRKVNIRSLFIVYSRKLILHFSYSVRFEKYLQWLIDVLQFLYCAEGASLKNMQEYKWYKLLLSFLTCFLLGVPSIVLYFIGTPFQRGFYCDDDSIRYPHKGETMSAPLVGFLGFGVPLIGVSN